MNWKILILCSAVFTLGCMRTGAYRRPVPPVPAAWPKSAETGMDSTAAAEASDVAWRDFFTDARLRSVIELALANNRDLRTAALNTERVQALYRIQRADQYPTVGVSATGSLYRLPTTARIGSFNIPQSVTFQQYNLSLGTASWELDFFGRIRSLKRVALENFLATEQARSATQIALVGAVANTYLGLLADRQNLRLAEETLETQQTTYQLIGKTRDAGMASDLEVSQAQSQVEAARADIARYLGRIAQGENALNLLAGTTIPPELLSAPDLIESVREIRAGLPSDVLLRRPDIVMAEHQLRAAHANIDAARANFFPRIALTAGAGFMSADLGDLLKGAARTWSFAPEAAIPIFDRGRRRANLRVAEVDRDMAVAAYEASIQSAFREVSDSLALRTRLGEEQQAQQDLVNALDRAHRLADARYKAGMDSYLNVLVSQRSLYAAQQVLINVRTARLSNLITLYKVLGGGA